jgi:hypothetical protein
MWITMLALKDKDGFVAASIPGLAHAAIVTRDECEKALKVFESPDPDSRTKDNDGRRIEKVDGGWIILNHFLYRDGLSDDPETARARERMRRFRAKRQESATESAIERDITGQGVTDRNVTLGHVTQRNPVSVSDSSSPKGKQEGEEKKPEGADHSKPIAIARLKPGMMPGLKAPIKAVIPSQLAAIEGFESEWFSFLESRKQKKAVPTEHAKELLLATLSQRPGMAIAALQEAIVRNWTGFKWEWLQERASKGQTVRGKPMNLVPPEGIR